LVVRAADPVVYGDFRFAGPLIVAGPTLGFGTVGIDPTNRAVYGSAMINETAFDGAADKELVLKRQGGGAVQSVCAGGGAPSSPARLASVIAGLPATVQQLSSLEVCS
jgi:hypothetical protein